MSTRYFIVCRTCKEEISIVDRSFRGEALTPEAKRKLPEFVILHTGHKINLISEFDKMELMENDK
jgi:hypothetical protein